MKLLKMLWHFEHAVVHWSHLFTAKPQAWIERICLDNQAFYHLNLDRSIPMTLSLADNKVFWLSSWGAVRCQALREHQVHRHNTEF